MKYFLLSVSAFALAACGGSENPEAEETIIAEVEETLPTVPSSAEVCGKLIEGDAEMASEMAEDGATPADICACFGTTVDALPEAERALHISVMTAVTAIRTEASVGVEEAAEALEERLRAGTGGYGFSEDDFEATGRLLNSVGNQIEDGGTCAAG